MQINYNYNYNMYSGPNSEPYCGADWCYAGTVDGTSGAFLGKIQQCCHNINVFLLADDNEQTARIQQLKAWQLTDVPSTVLWNWTRKMGTFWSQCRQNNQHYDWERVTEGKTKWTVFEGGGEDTSNTSDDIIKNISTWCQQNKYCEL